MLLMTGYLITSEIFRLLAVSRSLSGDSMHRGQYIEPAMSRLASSPNELLLFLVRRVRYSRTLVNFSEKYYAFLLYELSHPHSMSSMLWNVDVPRHSCISPYTRRVLQNKQGHARSNHTYVHAVSSTTPRSPVPYLPAGHGEHSRDPASAK